MPKHGMDNRNIRLGGAKAFIKCLIRSTQRTCQKLRNDLLTIISAYNTMSFHLSFGDWHMADPVQKILNV